jgi:repressor LexA
MTQEELAQKLGVARATVASWETGRRDPDTETLSKISKHCIVSIDWLLGKDKSLPPDAIPIGPTTKIPVLGTISAGLPLYAEQQVIEYVDVPVEEVKSGEYFYLVVKGDSMTGSRIYPGDRVLVRRQEEVDNGQIAVVMVGKEEATLKRVKFLEEAIILYPDNPKYEPQIYKAGEVRIIGRVVKVEFRP